MLAMNLREAALLTALACFRLLPLADSSPSITRAGHQPPDSATLLIKGVGAGPFSPTRFSSWHYDARFPLIPPNPGGKCPGNIYNANCVWNGATDWNIFFGGWDGVSSCHDSVSLAVTGDSFETINAHVPAVATESMIHVNNPCALKVGPNEWYMVYTQDIIQDGAQINKPGMSRSTDGLHWTPNEGGQEFLTVRGFPYNWTAADVNGGNVLIRDNSNGTLHFYFVDMKQLSNHSVFHATAASGSALPTEFTYVGIALPEPGRIVNDIKRVNGYNLLGMHANGPAVYYSASQDLDRFPSSTPLFSHRDAADRYIVSLGFVVDGDSTTQEATRVLGAVYGAGAVPQLDNNRVYASWLQRHVLFVGNDSPPTVWGIGDAERALGPDSLQIATNQGNLTGRFMVYDTDYVNTTSRGTLLLEGPVVTVAPGDIWQFHP